MIPIVVLEVIKQARTDLQIIAVDKLDIFERLETVERLIPLSPDETLATCFSFMYHLRDCDDCNGYDGNLRRIGNTLFAAIRAWLVSNRLAFHAGRKNWDRGDVESVCVGRWESKGGKYWAELWWGRFDYSYRSNNSGGSVCNPNLPFDKAVLVMQAKVDRGMFLTDTAVVPMKRVS